MSSDDIIPGAEPAEKPEATESEFIKVPDQIKYGICIFETTDDLSEPIVHVHAPGEYQTISVGHLYRLLASALKGLEAEIIYSKFQDKARQGSRIITRPGS